MEACIIADQKPARPTFEVNGKTYIEDIRGRLIPADQYEELSPPVGIVEINGRPHVQDAEGRWIDWSLVKPKDQLIDEVVRKIMTYALDLSAQVSRFRRHTGADLDGVIALLEQEYRVTIGGPGGNFTLRTFDDLQRVELKVGKFMELGPEIHMAKALIDEYLREITSEATAELKTLVLGAFEVDKKGKLDRQKILDLRKYDIKDERWVRAMQAISDAERTVMVR
ncbi:DUF3164 family protein, partial [Shinella sp. BYT-45]|uniref:DUF3164 family protein n=1 Tax=Shinella sp. BYT-45 TaxID=3377377 RepID=UPI003980B5B0